MARDNTRDRCRELRWRRWLQQQRVCPANRVGGGRGVMPLGSETPSEGDMGETRRSF